MSSDQASLNDKIDTILGQEKIVNRHSLFQLKYFVINKEPTHQRRLWRCIEELKVRKDGLDALQLQIDETEDNIELCVIELEKMENERKQGSLVVMDEREYKIMRRKSERKRQSLFAGLQRLLKTKQEQEEEARFFAESFQILEKQEPLKPFDDFHSQLEYWNERYAQMLNMKILLQLPIDTELVSSVLSLPDGSPVRRQAVALLENQQKQFLALKQKKSPPANAPATQNDVPEQYIEMTGS